MSATGGSIESLTLKGRYFAVDGESAPGRKLGGFENETKVNGDGSTRTTKKRAAWMISDIAVSIDDDNGDQEFLQDLADLKGEFPVSVSYASGKVYQGKGQINGEISVDSQEQTAGISLSGSKKLTPQ